MILFPGLVSEPLAAAAAPPLFLESIAVRAWVGSTQDDLSLDENGRDVAKYEDPGIPSGRDAGELSSRDDDDANKVSF